VATAASNARGIAKDSERFGLFTVAASSLVIEGYHREANASWPERFQDAEAAEQSTSDVSHGKAVSTSALSVTTAGSRVNRTDREESVPFIPMRASDDTGRCPVGVR
jgi:hypothetical protein